MSWKMDMGASILQDGSVCFRVWAPKVKEVSLKLIGPFQNSYPMKCEGDGVFSVTVPSIPEGEDYYYVLDNEKFKPDPCSRHQPSGVTGPSRVVDPNRFEWTDNGWKGLLLSEMIIYELHVGTFTQEGTFEAIISKLPHFQELGITAIELMPVAEFSGTRNWGYDGVFPYAPQSSYGGPEGLKRLINACHCAGIAVILDVVYNHIGPEGACLNDFGNYFTARYRTPWGDAVNFDDAGSDSVRHYFISNALYWLTEFHFDGLRMDAIEKIFDQSPCHILQEISTAFHRQGVALGRKVWLTAESDLNDIKLITPMEDGGWGIDAQWNDDFHHSIHSVFVAEMHGYMVDFGKLEDLGKAILNSFVYDGKKSIFRRKKHGTCAAKCPGYRFISAIQNHDQVANYDFGNRIGKTLSIEQQKLAAMILMCSPSLPLLFMGQEYGETAPFNYFTSHNDPALIESVCKGRKEEWPVDQNAFPNPQDPETFNRCRLQWELLEEPSHRDLLLFYKDLISIRKTEPCLSNGRKNLTKVHWNEAPRWIVLERNDPSGSSVILLVNLSNASLTIEQPVTLSSGYWELALWSGEEAPIQNGHDIELFPWGAALYIHRE